MSSKILEFLKIWVSSLWNLEKTAFVLLRNPEYFRYPIQCRPCVCVCGGGIFSGIVHWRVKKWLLCCNNSFYIENGAKEKQVRSRKELACKSKPFYREVDQRRAGKEQEMANVGVINLFWQVMEQEKASKGQ